MQTPQVQLAMTEFLQETLWESGLKANAHILGTDAFKVFFPKVCSKGESLSATEIAKLFDDFILDNLSHPQLVSMCKYTEINAFGTDNFLSGMIRSRLMNFRKDDQAMDA